MPTSFTTELLPVKKLQLDLQNFRVPPQRKQIDAALALKSLSENYFVGLIESFVESGILPTENIIVQRKKDKFVVREGNRRVAVLKMLLGQLPISDFELNDDLVSLIEENIDSRWKKENSFINCAVYPEDDNSWVHIVSMIHGKGEKSGRDAWKAVARSRFARDVLNKSEVALDLLEKYLTEGKNLTSDEKKHWSGEYGITVLDEAIRRIVPVLHFPSATEFVNAYPKVKYRDSIENLLHDIGMKVFGFKDVRDNKSLEANYGFPTKSAASSGPEEDLPSSDLTSTEKKSSKQPTDDSIGGKSPQKQTSVDPKSKGEDSKNLDSSSKKKAIAKPFRDPASVKRWLKEFTPRGKDREKIAALVEECRAMNLEKTPIAFCFLFRAMLEISAKVYIREHARDGLSDKKSDGRDCSLAEVLLLVRNHIISKLSGDEKSEKEKQLHGAYSELKRQASFLSITSMNQAVHNPQYSITMDRIAPAFGLVAPLLKELNS